MEDTERKKRERIYQDDMRHALNTTLFFAFVVMAPSIFCTIFVPITKAGNDFILIGSALGLIVCMIRFIALAIKAKRDRDRD